jgi:hypothetical protein
MTATATELELCMKGHKSRTKPKVLDCRYGAHFHKNRGQSADTVTALLLSPGTEGKLNTNYGIVQGLPTRGYQLTLQAVLNVASTCPI